MVAKKLKQFQYRMTSRDSKMSWMDQQKSDQWRSAVGSGGSRGIRGSMIARSVDLTANFKSGSTSTWMT